MARDSRLWEKAYSSYSEEKKNRTIIQNSIENKSPKKKKSRLFTNVPDIMSLQHEHSDITQQIKDLQRRQRTIRLLLRGTGYNPKAIMTSYFEKPIFLYALQLEDGCFYIGSSRNVEKRFKKHLNGKGAEWTKLYPPLSIIEERPTNTNDEAQAAKLEDDMTLEYALKHGSALVRGGGFCQSKPRWPDIIIQNEKFT